MSLNLGLGLALTRNKGVGVAAINTLRQTLVDAGIWSGLAYFYLYAGRGESAVRIDLVSGLVLTGTATYSAPGFTGNGSSYYLDTGVAPATNAIMERDSAHRGVWVGGANAQEAKHLFGGTDSRWLLQPRNASDQLIYRAGDVGSGAVAVTESRGHVVLNRTGASDRRVYRNGSLLTSDTQASAAESSSNMLSLAYDTIGTSNSARTILAEHAGRSLTDAEQQTLHRALSTCLAALGVIPNYDLVLVGGQSNGIHGSAGAPAVTSGAGFNYGAATEGALAWGALSTTGYSAVSTPFTGTFMPAFANEWYARKGRGVALVNMCRGGTSLLAAADTGSGNWSPAGTVRGSAVTTWNNAIKALLSTAHINSVRVAFLQGENDAIGHNGTTVTGALYQAALVELADYFAANVTTYGVAGIDEMLIVQTGAHRDGLYPTGFAAIRQAQNDACAGSATLRMIYDQAYTFPGLGQMDDTLHYNQTALNGLGTAAAANAASGLELAA